MRLRGHLIVLLRQTTYIGSESKEAAIDAKPGRISKSWFAAVLVLSIASSRHPRVTVQLKTFSNQAVFFSSRDEIREAAGSGILGCVRLHVENLETDSSTPRTGFL